MDFTNSLNNIIVNKSMKSKVTLNNETIQNVYYPQKNFQKYGRKDKTIQALFIGPVGQNMDFFIKMIQKAMNSHLAARVEYGINDARHITKSIKNDSTFIGAQDQFQKTLDQVLTKLKDLNLPFFSARYFGHMNSETTIPALVGNFATMLYNPNNCAFEGGPITTVLQIDVMKQFAKMFDYPPIVNLKRKNAIKQQKYSWGHLTCGGTVANCETLWAARNCRYLGLSIRKYIESIQNKNGIRDIEVELCNGTKKKLLDLTAWEIINITNQDTMQLYDLAFQILYKDITHDQNSHNQYQKGVSQFSMSKAGIIYLNNWLNQINFVHPQQEWKDNYNMVPIHKAFVSAAGHYSLNKSASLLGLGESMFDRVVVDLDSRMSIASLRKKLMECLRKKVPVLAVVGIAGTTQESSVDNLAQIYRLKQNLSSEGLYFHFHIDGSYGAYFVSMTKGKEPTEYNSYSSYVQQQLEKFRYSDSITFDPHKTGYVPYSCGGLIYRNHRLKDNINFSAPYIQNDQEINMGIYGIEGSKPGSSVVSVYLSLQMLPLVRKGHGELLQKTLLNSKIFTASLYRIKQIDIQYPHQQGTLYQRFDCFPLPRLYSQKINRPDLKQAELQVIKQISQSSPDYLSSMAKLNPANDFEDKIYYQFGSDLNIVCYGLNFLCLKNQSQQWNRSLKKFNQFNRALIKLSKPVSNDISLKTKNIYLSGTEISKHTYGSDIFEDFLKRYNLDADGQEQIIFIRSTIMNAFFAQATVKNHCSFSNHIFLTLILEKACETLLFLKWR